MHEELLHPNHTPEFVALHLQQTGRYPGERRTGRSTALALELIVKAMREPRKWHGVRDHHRTKFDDDYLLDNTRIMVDKLGLKSFVFKDNAITWGLPE